MNNDTYRDDPKHFAQTADSARPGPGLGDPQDAPTTDPRVLVESADWKDGVGPLGDASPLAREGGPREKDDQHPPSRSADPGQSSSGGFKNEGPADDGDAER